MQSSFEIYIWQKKYLDAKSKIELSISLMTVVLQTNVSTLIYTLTAESHTALNTGRVQRTYQRPKYDKLAYFPSIVVRSGTLSFRSMNNRLENASQYGT